MKNLIKQDIDDLLTLNNRRFECAIDDVYPPELQLKKTTECPTSLSYLDITITIDNGKYSTAAYDKRALKLLVSHKYGNQHVVYTFPS